MKTLIPAIIKKLKENPAIKAKFGDNIYALWNQNQPGVLTTANKFPFIGVTTGIINRVHEGSQLVYEALQPKIFIYHEKSLRETNLVDELLDFQQMVKEALEYDINFTGTGYVGAEIYEVLCIQMGEPEPFTDENHQYAARISLVLQYERLLEEVLI